MICGAQCKMKMQCLVLGLGLDERPSWNCAPQTHCGAGSLWQEWGIALSHAQISPSWYPPLLCSQAPQRRWRKGTEEQSLEMR